MSRRSFPRWAKVRASWSAAPRLACQAPVNWCPLVRQAFPLTSLLDRSLRSVRRTPTSTSIRSTFRANFAADIPEATTRLMAVTQRPLALLAFSEPSAAAAWKTIPSWSLVAMQDHAIGWANTSFMAERTVTKGKGHVTEISAAHAAMVSHPEAVAALIREVDGSSGKFRRQTRDAGCPRSGRFMIPPH